MKKMPAAVAAVLLLSIGSYWNPDQSEWKITQLTECEQGSSGSPWISPDGSMVFFISTCDLADDNGDHNTEVFKWENESFTQLTRTSQCRIMDLALSPDARRLAFATNCPLQGKNKDLGLEIAFMENPEKINVLTQGLGFPSRHPSWSANGRYLVFESRADFDRKNPDAGTEIFLADFSATPPRIKQISDTPGPRGCEAPRISLGSIMARCNDDVAGTKPAEALSDVVVTIEGRPMGGNPDRNWEIVSFDLSGKPRQITRTELCENGPPAVHPQGRMIAFTSDCELLKKEKLANRPALYFSNPAFIEPFPELSFAAWSLAWSGDGRVLAFASSLSGKDENPEQNQEIYLTRVSIDYSGAIKAGPPELITDFPFGGSTDPRPDREGRRIVFVSNTNYKGKNNDGGSEIFMAVHEKPVPAEEPIEPEPAAGAAETEPAAGATSD